MNKKSVIIRSLVVLFCLISFLSCAGVPGFKYLTSKGIQTEFIHYPQTRFAVFTDIHIYDHSLGSDGEAFEKYRKTGGKLYLDSLDVIDEAANRLITQKPDFLIIPGDLTKDGELVNHNLCVLKLSEFKKAGIQVYVVPGNHDIKNGFAYSFSGDTKTSVQSILPADFKRIYNDYGFGNAIYQDENSLSYAAEPVPGLWLLALDSCIYKDNRKNEPPAGGGEFSVKTLLWIEQVLIDAQNSKKAVIAMMHHSLMEHYKTEKKYYSQFIVKNSSLLVNLFTKYHVKLLFTGHFHSQDITLKPENNQVIYDIETGSFVTYPNPYRIVNITDQQKAVISSYRIDKTKGRGIDFAQYSQSEVKQNIENITTSFLEKLFVSKNETEIITRIMTDALLGHFTGDEQPGATALDYTRLGAWAGFLLKNREDLILGLLNDLLPPDNNITINLETGEWESSGVNNDNERIDIHASRAEG